jgi:PAS domain S-box-containing protein
MALTRVKDGTYFDINPSLEKMFNLQKADVIGFKTSEFLDWSIESERMRLHEIFAKQGFVDGEKMRIKNLDGTKSEVLVFAKGFEIAGESYLLGMNLDITKQLELESQLAKSLEEKEILLKELQHRVKNSLAIVSGLLSMEAFKVKDEGAKKSFLSAQARITSMSKVYESLYQSRDLETVQLGNYIQSLVHSMSDIFVMNQEKIRFDLKTETVQLDLKRALPLGLILNELLTNALKYAYPGDRSGVIRIDLSNQEGNISLLISDDGEGLPEGVSIEKQGHFGYELIRSLTTQLKGVFSSVSKKGEGLTVIISFPL